MYALSRFWAMCSISCSLHTVHSSCIVLCDVEDKRAQPTSKDSGQFTNYFYLTFEI